MFFFEIPKKNKRPLLDLGFVYLKVYSSLTAYTLCVTFERVMYRVLV